MKIKVSNATNHQINWLVSKCEGMDDEMLSCFDEGEWLYAGSRRYSTDWAQGGPIIEREKICVCPTGNTAGNPWSATDDSGMCTAFGPTLLIAAMRCFCCSKLGGEVEVPNELA